jgi:uncharacterized repeat protein (TIGR03803 family)
MKLKHYLSLSIAILIAFTLNAQTTPEFWGMTSLGGEFEQGNIYKTDGNGENFNPIHHFQLNTGVKPQGSMILASNGNLFGMTLGGGTYNNGVLFELNPDTNGYMVRVNFDGEISGSAPFGTLMQASDGLIYGTTTYGSIDDGGVIFAYNPETTEFEVLWELDDITGKNPRGYMIQASDGKLYGMAELGGMNGCGTIFSYDMVNDTCEDVFDFDTINGMRPYGSLTEASDGKLYGMVTFGGVYEDGVIFKFDPETKDYTKIMDFGHPDGRFPYGSLLEVQEGVFYGLTFRGGNNDNGVLFSYDFMNDVYTKKIDFIDSLQGKNPYSTLMPATNGKLYGTALYGGVNDQGVLFEYDYENEILTVKFNFNGFPMGGSPMDRPVEVNGSLGTEEITCAEEYRLYPNPTDRSVTLELGENYRDVRVIIYDAAGRLINQLANFSGPEAHVNIEGSTGVYFVTIIGKERETVFKVLKK